MAENLNTCVGRPYRDGRPDFTAFEALAKQCNVGIVVLDCSQSNAPLAKFLLLGGKWQWLHFDGLNAVFVRKDIANIYIIFFFSYYCSWLWRHCLFYFSFLFSFFFFLFSGLFLFFFLLRYRFFDFFHCFCFLCSSFFVVWLIFRYSWRTWHYQLYCPSSGTFYKFFFCWTY